MFYQSFCTVLQQLLHSSSKSLERIHFVCDNNIGRVLGSLNWPKLGKLEEFEFCSLSGCEPLLDVITRSLDYGKALPALKRLSLRRARNLQGDVVEEENNEEGNQEENHEERNIVHLPRLIACKTVDKLEVDLTLRTVSFSQLKATFPAVLHLILAGLEPHNLPSFWQIFRLWPKLEKLELQGQGRAMGPYQNYDAEFCGISKDEMRAYYGKDDEFLRALHRVPIRPAISTLLSEFTNYSASSTGTYVPVCLRFSFF